MGFRCPQHVLEGTVPHGGARDAWRVAEGGAPEASGMERQWKMAGVLAGFTRENWGIYHNFSETTWDFTRKLRI